MPRSSVKGCGSVANTLWSNCKKGYVPSDMCPDCCPPVEDRCTNDDIGYVCRVLGPHTRHNNGMGTVWVREEENDEDE